MSEPKIKYETFKKIDASNLIEMGIVEKAVSAAFKRGWDDESLSKFKRVGGVFVRAAYVGEDPNKLEERRVKSSGLMVPNRLPVAPTEQHELIFEFRRTLRHPGLFQPASLFRANLNLQRHDGDQYSIRLNGNGHDVVEPLGGRMSAAVFDLITESVQSGPDEQLAARINNALRPVTAPEGA